MGTSKSTNKQTIMAIGLDQNLSHTISNYELQRLSFKVSNLHVTLWNNTKEMKKTLHKLTHGTVQGCEWTSWVLCINDSFRDIREKNVTKRSEI